MKNNKSQKYPGYLTYELFVSQAYRALTPAAKEILILLFFEINMSSRSKRKKKYTPTVVNRDEIILPYREISERLGYSEKTIWSSMKQLLAHGFIEIVKYGGGSKGDFQIYGIREDWRKWTMGQEIRTLRRNGMFGWQKKISSTLSKSHGSNTGKPLSHPIKGGLPSSKSVALNLLVFFALEFFTQITAL